MIRKEDIRVLTKEVDKVVVIIQNNNLALVKAIELAKQLRYRRL